MSAGDEKLGAWRGNRVLAGAGGSFDPDSGPGANDEARMNSALADAFSGLVGLVPDVDEFEQKTGTYSLGMKVDPTLRLGRNGATGRVTGNNSALRTSTRNARLLQGLSVREALGFIMSLKGDELIALQRQMALAGLYGDVSKAKINWGLVDDATAEAYQNLIRSLIRNPDLTVDETMEKLTSAFSQETLAKMESGEDGSGGKTAKGPQNILLQPEVTSAETLADMIDQVSQDLLGRDASPDRKASLIATLQQRQKDEFYATTYKQAQNEIANARPGATTGGGSELEAFMNAIMGQESGGDPNVVNQDSGAQGLFQIMPDNWVPWAREAGADPADRSAANQRKVAGFQMQKYYNMFGNWRDVAIAWYAGPGAIGQSWLNNPQDGYPSVNSYADQAMAKFNELKNAGGGQTAYQDPTLAVEFRDKLDLTSEARSILRAANPAEYEARKFASRAQDWFKLLAGVQ